MAKRSKSKPQLNNLVVVSDIHAGCRLALCPPGGVPLDDGGTYHTSPLQDKLWAMWRTFWDEFVPTATRGEPFGVVINGDCVDGVHHNSTTQISHNLMDQSAIASAILAPIAKACDGRIWMVRGTEAHVGQSATMEEGLAKSLGAIPSAEGQHARWDLWKSIGHGKLVHFLHHIGTTGSQAYEATAVHKELVEEFVEAARWRRQAPDVIVRSHRHRYLEDTIATGSETGETCRAIAVVTPAWQGKTPFVWKIPGGRLSTPQFGGIVIRWVDDDRQLFVIPKVWTVDRSGVE
jgi:hypothetical protein